MLFHDCLHKYLWGIYIYFLLFIYLLFIIILLWIINMINKKNKSWLPVPDALWSWRRWNETESKANVMHSYYRHQNNTIVGKQPTDHCGLCGWATMIPCRITQCHLQTNNLFFFLAQSSVSWMSYLSMACIFTYILSFGMGPGGDLAMSLTFSGFRVESVTLPTCCVCAPQLESQASCPPRSLTRLLGPPPTWLPALWCGSTSSSLGWSSPF